MGLFTKHQYTDVTTIVNDCCVSNEESDDEYDYLESKVERLLDAIKRQNDYVEPGPVEAARALRKKLKYGTVDQQCNGLKLFDLLVASTCDSKYMKLFFNDDKIIDRLTFFFTDGKGDVDFAYDSAKMDPSMRKPKKVVVQLSLRLGEVWSRECQGSPNMARILDAYQKAIDDAEKSKRKSSSRKQRVPDFMNDDADMDYEFESYEDSSRPRTNAELDKKFKIPRINYDKEAPKILQLIAQANIISTNLMNTLNTLPKEELSIHSIKANDGFDECRSIRRKVLRYLQLVQREELLGPLLKCNDELVAALKKYEDRSVPYGILINDSDSDEDSLANYESDHESIINRSYVSRSERDPPTSASDVDVVKIKTKAPPAVPPKSSVLRSERPVREYREPKPEVSTSESRREALINEYDPFSDMNEVAPVRWG